MSFVEKMAAWFTLSSLLLLDYTQAFLITYHPSASLSKSSKRLLRREICTVTLDMSSKSNFDNGGITSLIREAISKTNDQGAEIWDASVEILPEETAESVLMKAYGWTAWAKASEKTKKYHRPKLPDPKQIQDSLRWLQTGPLHISQEEHILLTNMITTCPEACLLRPQDQYKSCRETAPRSYRDQLVDLIRNDPSVFELSYNCDGGGCASECGRCWVSYENRIP
jgi:hypothetical protein